MKFFIQIIMVLMPALALAQEPIIKVGEARAKKSNLAFPVLNNVGSAASGEAKASVAEIYNTAKKDLEVSAVFTIQPPSAYLENTTNLGAKPKTLDSNGFKFDSWKTINTEFLVRGTYYVAGPDITVEIYLYNVDQEKLVVGKRYKAPLKQPIQIGHSIANDILEALTGQRGFFLSKLIATYDKSGYKEVITMNWDGTDRDTLTSDKSIAISPNWSPNGRKVLYSIYTKKVGANQQNLTLFLHDLDRGKRVILSNRNGLNSGGTFTPDGNAVYLTISKNGLPNIYKLNLQGDELAQLTKGPSGAMNVEAAVSPDGKQIAFSSDRGGNPMIYVMNSDGSNVRRLTFQGKYNSSPSWSPDGKKIAFAGQIDTYFDVFVMDANGSNIQRVTSALKANGKRASHEDPSFSPDGRFLVYTSNRTGKNQIYINTLDGNNEQRVTNDSYNYFKPKWSKSLE